MFLRRIIQIAAISKNRSIAGQIRQGQHFLLPQTSISSRYYSRFIEDDDEDELPTRRLPGNRSGQSFQSGGYRQTNYNNNNNKRFQSPNSGYRRTNNYETPRQSYKSDQRHGFNLNTKNGFAGSQIKPPSWEELELVEFKKDFYEPHPNTLNRSAEEVKKYRDEHEISVSRDAPNPILSVDELNMPDYAVKEFKAHNFTELTPIQAQGWPIVLSGKNLVGVAQTG